MTDLGPNAVHVAGQMAEALDSLAAVDAVRWVREHPSAVLAVLREVHLETCTYLFPPHAQLLQHHPSYPPSVLVAGEVHPVERYLAPARVEDRRLLIAGGWWG